MNGSLLFAMHGSWHKSKVPVQGSCPCSPAASRLLCGTRQCRIIIYKKGLEDRIDIVTPALLGGLNSEAYLALNPQGKMPLLAFPAGDPIAESEVLTPPVHEPSKSQNHAVHV